MRLDEFESINPVWTLETAEIFVRSITRIATDSGFKIDIVGGVKSRGYSNNDLDLSITSVDGDEEMFIYRLEETYEIIKAPASMGMSHYILTTHDDKEVDLFIN